MRKCYFEYLIGNYEEAMNSLETIQMNTQFNPQYHHIASDYFKRILSDPLENAASEDQQQQYEIDYLKALQF